MKSVRENKNEIFYNIINSFIAGALVFLGSVADGTITSEGIGVAIIAGLLVAFTKFQQYWKTQESEYSSKIMSFI
jgi:fluoride ion exporter CrcB/FEX